MRLRISILLAVTSIVTLFVMAAGSIVAQTETESRDVPCGTLYDSQNQLSSVLLSINPEWSTMEVGAGSSNSFSEWVMFLADTGMIIQAGTNAYNGLRNQFPYFLCSAASPKGTDLLIVQYIPSDVFVDYSGGLTVQELLWYGSYNLLEGRPVPTWYKQDTSNPGVTAFDVFYVAERGVFRVLVSSNITNSVAHARELSLMSTSLRLERAQFSGESYPPPVVLATHTTTLETAVPVMPTMTETLSDDPSFIAPLPTEDLGFGPDIPPDYTPMPLPSETPFEPVTPDPTQDDWGPTPTPETLDTPPGGVVH